jgi:hypothetical protein
MANGGIIGSTQTPVLSYKISTFNSPRSFSYWNNK